MIKNAAVSALCLVPLLFLSGCFKQQISVTSNAFADAQAIPAGFPAGSSFAVVSDQGDGQLFSKEVKRKITILLEDAGYRVASPDEADYRLVFKWDMTTTVKTETVPVYTSGETKIKYKHVSGSKGSAYYQERTQYPDTVTYVQQQRTIYHKTLVVRVYDANVYREVQQEDELWQGSAASSDQDGDARHSVDYLLVSAFKHFGHSSNTVHDAYDIN